jgi:hypothetical protein
MSEIATMIETAAEYGVSLDVSDFRRSGDALFLDGMPADDWFAAMFETAPDRLEDREI